MDACAIGYCPYQDSFEVSRSPVDKNAVFWEEKVRDQRQTVGLKSFIRKQVVYLHKGIIIFFYLLREIISGFGSIIEIKIIR